MSKFTIRKKISSCLLKLAGWRYEMKEEFPQKCLFCVAPHTSNWDLLLGELFYFASGGRHKVHFFIKKEWFFFPLNYFFNAIGGLPVDRQKKNSLVEQMIQRFNAEENFCLAVTPEATRKANPNWKKGFYYIAQGADVPILLGYLDYSKKVVGVEKIFIPTGDLDTDMDEIKKFYLQFKGRYPENFAI